MQYIFNSDAEKEKALLDMLYFRSNTLTASVVLEKLQEHRQDIDFEKLQWYAKSYGIGMVRKVGFLLDHIDIDTHELYNEEEVKRNSFSKLTNTAHQFNAKWRLYYDSALIN